MSKMAVAEVRTPLQNTPVSTSRVLQRCMKKPLMQRAAAGRAPETVPPIVHEVLRSPGAPLDAATRAFMEPRFGHDFSRVRVHTDTKAAESARAVGALAYTVGRDVVFGTGWYDPKTFAGKSLLAHELAHVVQQQGASYNSSSDSITIGKILDKYEIEAHEISQTLGKNTVAHRASPVHLSTSRLRLQGFFSWVHCRYLLWRFSDTINECNEELREHCGAEASMEDCIEYLDGEGKGGSQSQWLTEALMRCVQRRRPDMFARLLSTCSKASLGHLLKK